MSKKIYISFVILSLALVGLFLFGIYDLTNSSLIRIKEADVKSNILSISEYTADDVDKSDLQFLIDNINPNISPHQIARITTSSQYGHVLAQLRRIQEHFSKYCSFIYIIYPLDEKTYFVIGADSISIQNLDKYSVPFGTSEFPYMEKALKERRSIVEPKVSYDSQYKKYSISSYAPIWNGEHFLGVVGLDLEKGDYHKLLYTYMAISAIIAVVGLSSIFMATIFLIERAKINLYKRK